MSVFLNLRRSPERLSRWISAVVALACLGGLVAAPPAQAQLQVQAQSSAQSTAPSAPVSFLARGGTPGLTASTDQVQGRLLVPVDSVQAGQTVALGLEQRIAKGWHTYWANPGDSGLPTTITFTAPPGTTAAPIEWPTPQRYEIGPLVNYGYGGTATLLTRLTVPADAQPGSRWSVQADVRWLVCADVCIPQDVRFAFSLPVRATPGTPTPDAALIEAARSHLPQPLPQSLTWERPVEGGLALTAPADALPPHDTAYFFPGVPLQVVHAGPQTLQRGASPWTLALQAGESPPAAGDRAVGVLVLEAAGQPARAWAVNGGAPDQVPEVRAPPAGSPVVAAPRAEPFSWGALALAAGLALLGGLVLNLMPCVFPVLSIKALSVVRMADADPRTLRLQGLAYTAGVLVCLLALAGGLLALRAAGQSVGWGFQFQSPAFVLGMALLLFAMGLQLSGAVSIGGGISGIGQSLTERRGAAGSFFTGVLAVVVATPCTAPFMGAAIGYAVAQPAAVTLAVFAALGLGLALPFLLLCLAPPLQRLLPRPGAWMERFKQFMAFPMYASAAWLAWVLAQQAGPRAVAVGLAAALAVAFAAWLWSTSQPARALGNLGTRRMGWTAGAVAVLVLAGGVGWGLQSVRGGAMAAAELAAEPADLRTAERDGATDADRLASGWTPYTPERLQSLRQQGRPVFVNLTAAWCITCLMNERVALDIERVDRAFVEAGIVRLKGDWTRGDPRITTLLAEHGRSGVPLYLMFPAGGGEPEVLPQILSPERVLEAIRTASGERVAADRRP